MRPVLQPHKGASETRATKRFSPSAGRLQPHKGASETRTRPRAAWTRLYFNPTRVRLKRRCRPCARSGCNFNPTRVRLKLCEVFDFGLGQGYFNPTRVRLKPVFAFISRPVPIRLQPHKGASETGRSVRSPTGDVVLQPHKGASETLGLYDVTDVVDTSTPQGCV